MNKSTFPTLLNAAPFILGEGALIERLRRQPDIELDPNVVNSAFIYEPLKRTALETICRQYLDIGCKLDVPLLVSTPTWRASRERIAAAGLAERDVNGDNFNFLATLRAQYGAYADKVVICGLMSCRGDAYCPDEALSVKDAAVFHRWQAEKLAATGADFLLASTLPALSEATGLAMALADTGRPYIISFVARPAGTLLDGTPLHDAITMIDQIVTPRPLAYMINCTHASIAREAMLHETNSSPLVRQRIIGLLANTAALSPEELNGRTHLVEEKPEEFATGVTRLHRELGLKILGGCCGTDERHIYSLGCQLAASG